MTELAYAGAWVLLACLSIYAFAETYVGIRELLVPVDVTLRCPCCPCDGCSEYYDDES